MVNKSMCTQHIAIQGEHIDTWLNSRWEPVQGVATLGSITTAKGLPHLIGVYMFILNDDIVYVGRAVEKGKGLAKRLCDYVRASNSARNFNGGRLANKYAKKILIRWIACEDAACAKLIELYCIETLHPAWNTRDGLRRWYEDFPQDRELIKIRGKRVTSETKQG